jgi:hypothetical protein
LAKSGFISQTTKEENLYFICLQETRQSDFSANELKHFRAGKEFIWSWTKPKGRSGGILVGVNVENFDIADISQGDFYIKFRLRNKNNNFEDRRRPAAAPCHASFPCSQHDLTASTTSSSNASSHRLPSRTETEVLHLRYRHSHRPPSPDSLTLTLYYYKNVIRTLVTLLTTQPYLYFTSSLARAPRHQTSIHRRCSLSPSSHVHRLSAQRHI